MSMKTFCKGCGAEIAFVRVTKADGKVSVIPLDKRAPVYKDNQNGSGERALGFYVSHFATCPKATDFSASNKERLLK